MKPLTIAQKGHLSVFEAFSQNDQTVVETFVVFDTEKIIGKCLEKILSQWSLLKGNYGKWQKFVPYEFISFHRLQNSGKVLRMDAASIN